MGLAAASGQDGGRDRTSCRKKRALEVRKHTLESCREGGVAYGVAGLSQDMDGCSNRNKEK